MSLDTSQFHFDAPDLEPDELMNGAVLLIRTSLSNDRTRLVVAADGLDWLTVRGMLEEAIDRGREEL